MKRWLSGLLVGLAVLVVGLALGKNLIAKAAVMGGVKMITGLDAQLGSMQVGLFKPVIAMKGFKVLNPAGYPDRVMFSMPGLYVEYDLGAFLGGRARLRSVRLDLEEFVVAKRADGQVNLKQIKALESTSRQPAQAQRKPKAAGKAPQLSIDVLELNVGTVLYKDYTKTPPMVQKFPVNIHSRYERITNPSTFAGLIVTQALMKTSVGRLANVDLAGLQAGVTDALKASSSLATDAMATGLGAAQEVGTSALGTTKEILQNPGEVAGEVKKTGQQALGAAKDAAGAVKKLFGN